jgi:hypothetical protein
LNSVPHFLINFYKINVSSKFILGALGFYLALSPCKSFLSSSGEIVSIYILGVGLSALVVLWS